MFFAAIFTLPDTFSREQKCKTFLFLLPILAQSLFSFQYNVTVAYIFLFAYNLLERDKGLWAVLLILLSGTTKVYGIFQLSLLLLYYPRFWRNSSYALLMALVLLALPMLKYPNPAELFAYYGEWLQSLATHQSATTFDSLIYAQPLRDLLLPNFRIVQAGTLAVLVGMLLACRKRYASPAFRAQTLGVLMSWIILFGDASEKHTYIIALAGYLLWHHSRTPNLTDKVLLWCNFILLCIVPIDLLFPKVCMSFICYTLWLNIWVFLITWLRMVRATFLSPETTLQNLESSTIQNISK